MANRKKMDYKALQIGDGDGLLSEHIYLREKTRLFNFFKNKLERGESSFAIKSMADVGKSVEKIMGKALSGYQRASVKSTPEKTLVSRIRFLSKYDRMPELWEKGEREELFSDSKPSKIIPDSYQVSFDPSTVEVDAPEPTYDDIEVGFLEFESAKELAFYKARKSIYMSEFEFNDSSDRLMLESVLMDEVLLRRYSNEKLAGKPVSASTIDELQKRIRESLKVLGVSRQQRIADDSSQKGNIAQVSMLLEDKIQEMRKLSDDKLRLQIIEKIIADVSGVSVKELYDYAEEILMLKARAARNDMEITNPIASVNSIPGSSDIEALLAEADHTGSSL